MSDNTMEWSMFASVKNLTAQRMRTTWPELCQRIKQAPSYPSKQFCPLLKLATFNGPRCNDSMAEISGVEGDYDSEQVTQAQAVAMLEAAGVRALVYASPSASTTAHRWRVLAPTSKPHPPEARAGLVARLNGALGGILAGESFTNSQVHYIGRTPVNREVFAPAMTFNNPEAGQFLDLLPELEAGAIGKVNKPSKPTPPARTEASHAPQLPEVWTNEETLRDLRSALAAMRCDDRVIWIDMGHALKTLGDRGRALWIEWGQTSEKWKPEDARLWDGFNPTQTSYKAVFKRAEQFGWVNPARRVQSPLRNLQSLPEVDFAGLLSRGRVDPETGEILAEAWPEPRFKLLKDADIDGMPDLEWLIHGILPTKGMGAVFGPSGSGKSFVIIDMACAIAEGRHWFGYRTTKTPIVYIVLEGAQGLKNRRRAWLKHHNRAALPDGIHFIVQPVNFMEGDVYELAEVLPPGCMTIVDTLNRAAPGADENASKDMGLILAATSAISRATGGLTVLVHHTGKNEDAGLRGHSSLKAALDGSIVVTRNGEARAWKADKSKDGPDGQSHPFKLEVVNLGFDKYGDTISSCVVIPDTSGRQHIKPLTPSQRSAIGTYCAACDEGLGLVSDSFEFLGLHLEAWRKVFYQLSPGDNEDSKRKAFNRARKDLIDNGLATVETDVYRITERTAATREGEFIEKTLIKNDSGTSGTKRDMSRTVPAQKPQNSGTSGTRLLGVSRCPAGIDPIQAETELGKNGEKSSSFSGADEDEGEI